MKPSPIFQTCLRREQEEENNATFHQSFSDSCKPAEIQTFINLSKENENKTNKFKSDSKAQASSTLAFREPSKHNIESIQQMHAPLLQLHRSLFEHISSPRNAYYYNIRAIQLSRIFHRRSKSFFRFFEQKIFSRKLMIAYILDSKPVYTNTTTESKVDGY